MKVGDKVTARKSYFMPFTIATVEANLQINGKAWIQTERDVIPAHKLKKWKYVYKF